jgi:hypothetical protein
LVANGTGLSSHLGNLTQQTSFCMNASNGMPLGPITGTLNAANGDKLNYTFIGAGIDAATGFVFQSYIFSGGTGRFAHACGNVTLLYNVNTPVAYSYTGSGSINY